jgi:pentatricopeptide repeat protein
MFDAFQKKTSTTMMAKPMRPSTLLTLLLSIVALIPSVTGLSLSPQDNRIATQQRRQESLDAGHHPVLSLNLNLDALARAAAPARAQELYQRIQALYEEGYYAAQPDVVSFNSVLKAWQSDPEQAVAFWETAVGQQTPNVRSYNTLLLSLAKAGMMDQAVSVLRHMQSQTHVVEDRITYNTVLLAAAVEPTCSSVRAAEGILKELIASEYLRPDVISYNTLLAAFAETGNAAKAEYWLRHMKRQSNVKADVYSYTTVLQAYTNAASLGSNSKKQTLVAADKAWALLQDMLTETSLQPNKVTYTATMQALCKAGDLNRANMLLETMLDQAARNPSIRPDAVSYTVLMDGWASAAADRPEQALRAVEVLWEQMQSQTAEWPDTTPTALTYTAILSTYAQSRDGRAPDRALVVLQTMRRQEGILPTVVHYNAALNCCAKAPRPDKVVLAASIYKDMQQVGKVPADIITYNTLLATAASSFGSHGRPQGLKLALEVWSLLQVNQEDNDDQNEDDDDKNPTLLQQTNSLTYYYLFKTIRKFMPTNAERWALVEAAFDECCRQACLNELVLEQVLQVTTEEQGRALLGDHWCSSSTADAAMQLPAKWTHRAWKNRRRRERRVD